MASALSSDGHVQPTLQSAPGVEEVPNLSQLTAGLRGLGLATNPVVPMPDPMSRGAVVQVSAVRGSDRDPLGGQTGRYIQAMTHDSPSRLFTAPGRQVDPATFQREAAHDPHQYRLVVALPDAHHLHLPDFTRAFMARVERDVGRPVDWLAAIDRQHGVAHVHVVVRGRDQEGAVVHLSQQYLQQGLRIRAQEVSTDALGPLPVMTQRGRDAASSLAMAMADRLERADGRSPSDDALLGNDDLGFDAGDDSGVAIRHCGPCHASGRGAVSVSLDVCPPEGC